MPGAGYSLPLCGAIGSKFVDDHHPWCMALRLRQLVQQALGRLGIAVTLYQHFQDEAVLIDGVSEPVLLSADRNDDLIKVPVATNPTGRTQTDRLGEDAAGKQWREKSGSRFLMAPIAHGGPRFIGFKMPPHRCHASWCAGRLRRSCFCRLVRIFNRITGSFHTRRQCSAPAKPPQQDAISMET